MLAEVGLVANSENISLQNNYAYFLILDGNLAQAKSVLESRLLNSEDALSRTSLLATRGLFHFRAGNPSIARDYYQKAFAQFEKRNDHRSYSAALLNYAREEALLMGEGSSAHLKELAVIAKKYKDDPYISLLVERFASDIDASNSDQTLDQGSITRIK